MKDIELPPRFTGDGRNVIGPLKRGEGIRVKRSLARAIIKAFNERGHSNHSSANGVSWIILEYCEHNGIEVEIINAFGGRTIRKKHG